MLYSDSQSLVIVNLLQAAYRSDYEGDSEDVRREVASMVVHINDLPMDMRRVLQDMSWNFTDELYKVNLYNERFRVPQ